MNTASYIERDCKITHQGREFEAGGAVVSDSHLIAYLGPCKNHLCNIDNGSAQHMELPGCRGDLHTWHGTVIGSYRITHTWSTPRSHVSSHMHQIVARIGLTVTLPSRVYTGRSAGMGMVFTGRRKAATA